MHKKSNFVDFYPGDGSALKRRPTSIQIKGINLTIPSSPSVASNNSTMVSQIQMPEEETNRQETQLMYPDYSPKLVIGETPDPPSPRSSALGSEKNRLTHIHL